MLARPCLLGALLLTACTAKPRAQDTADAPAPVQDPENPLEVTEIELPARALPEPDGANAAPPFQLTASDGTGLEVVSLKARAVVQGPLALTELHLTFDNPQSRTIEGRFQIDLPPNAAISRFAMKVDAGWQEGEVVERQAARRVYEDFLHRKQDPALLEKQAGNRFTARVFPIPANGRKELIVSYSQELPDGDQPYSLLLAGLPELEELDVQVMIDEAKEGGAATSVGGVEATRRVIKLHKESYMPTDDLRVESRAREDAVGLRSEGLAVARVPVVGSREPKPIDDLTILFDTSASRSLGFDAKVRRLGALVDAIAAGSDVHLRVIAFDNEVAKIFDGKATDFGDTHIEALYSRRAMGASDLQHALERMKLAGVSRRILLITDGIATAGKSEAVDLRAAVRDLGKAGLQRLDAVVDGGLRDEDVLESLTTSLSTSGIVVDGALGSGQIVSKLTKATYTDVKVSVPGSTFVWPTEVSGIQPGDEVLVYADLPDDMAMTVTLTGDEEIGSSTPLLTQVERPLLERALISARIASKTLERSTLPTNDEDGRRELAEQIVEMSTKHRVLSEFTALLVLETEADYRRFAIDRNALADILTVEAGGVALMQRDDIIDLSPVHPWIDELEGRMGSASPETPGRVEGPADRAAAEPTEADGGLGLEGTGRGGGGSSEGTIGLGNTGIIGRGGGSGTGGGYGYGGRGRRIPRIRSGKATVRGALDKDIIRRIVRAHMNEIRACYDQGLRRDANLKGKTTVEFTIGASGRVSKATQASTTVPNRNVNNCIVKAVKRWKFPRPLGRSIVKVVYPFVLGDVEPTHEVPETDEQRRAREKRERIEEEKRALEEAKRLAEEAKRKRLDGYQGTMLEVMTLLDEGSASKALDVALTWRDESPGDVLALISVGEALEAMDKPKDAARAYASLIDLFPSRADLRRYAGYRLGRLGEAGRALAVDTFRHAVEQRPDHPNSHRLLAYALLRNDQIDEALDAIEAGITNEYPEGRFAGVPRILREDMGIIAAVALAKDSSRAKALETRLAKHDAKIDDTASSRFVMSWETDSNDVDFHIHDGEGGHAYFSDRVLDSGGSLYADVTTGYGPECFTIEGTPDAFPYRFEANYYSRGPMGYGMGQLEIIQHDGKGGLVFDQRPFVIMKDRAFVPLGTLAEPLKTPG